MNTNHFFAIDRILFQYTILSKKESSNKYVDLYWAIKNCILKHELPHGWVLPSTRVLCEALSVSRTTVIKAYELLLLEKIIISKPGSGNRINYLNTKFEDSRSATRVQIDSDLYPQISDKSKSFLKNRALLNRLPTSNLAFRPGLPPIDVFPVNQWKKLLNIYWRHIKSSGLSYSKSTGLKEFKTSISNYLNISRNIKCDPDQIIIVSGSLQSLYLISNTLINRGDGVILENPLFPNVHSVFKSSEATLYPVELDKEGIDIKSLSIGVNTSPKLIHVTPSNHYPLGIPMSLKRRQEVLEWASNNNALVIENDYENEIANHFTKTPTLYSLDTEDRTIYMGTFNRLLHPSIRLGYMVVPRYLTSAIEALQDHSHRFVSPSIQVVMNQFIEKNYLYQHLKNVIITAKDRHDVFVKEFNKVSKNMYIKERLFSSFHVLALFKTEVSLDHEKELIDKLNLIGVTTLSLSKCYIGDPLKKGLILGYSSVQISVMRNKLKLMAKYI